MSKMLIIMKKYRSLKFLMAGLSLALLFYGCTDDFEEINTNERVLTELDAATLGNMYGRVQYRGFYMDYHQTSQNLFADHYCQYFANTQNAFSSDRYVLVGGWLNGSWNGFYNNIPNNLGEVLNATDPEVNPGFETLYALAQIWRVIVYERIANYWGPIPYTQVNNAEPDVPYDSERDIYLSFFSTLDEALGILNANRGGNAFGGNDQIYGGSIDKWITFANTLRLRIAMRISEVEPALAKAEAEKAVSDGVMTSNLDDAEFQCTANSIHNMPRMIPWNEFRMSATMESILRGYEDPRMSAYFSPAVDPEFGEYRGLRNGYEIVDLAKPGLFYDKLSAMGPKWQPVDAQSSITWEIMMSAEAYFLRAEGALKGWNMGGTAEELYNSGIEKSMIQWGITDQAAINAYRQSTNVPIATHDAPFPVTTIPVKYDPAVGLEQIMTQKWLALYPDGWEAWAEARRTDFPRMYPRMASENPDVAPDEMMRRVQFVSGEYETNAEAVQDAIQKLGGPDKGSTRLWWNPEK
jgi:hypothetical protein